MNNLTENKKLCLEQLRLTKYQLIWNREHEIRMLKEHDTKEITRLELEGKTDTKTIVALKGNIDQQIKNKEADIKYAKVEIEYLDKDIGGMKHVGSKD